MQQAPATGIVTLHHESPLGAWVSVVWRPPRLAGLVDVIWYFEGSLTHRRERVFPDGRVELNLHLGAPYGAVADGNREPFAEACVSGILPGAMTVEAPPGPVAVLGIRMFPVAASALLGLPLHELTGRTVDLQDLVPGAEAALRDRCAAAHGAEARVRAAHEWLVARTTFAESRGGLGQPAVAWAARQIEERRGSLSIGALQQQVGWSRSRFATAFREQVGVAPKQLARIVRFRHALELVHAGGATLAEVALRAGYADQPHFNADFREFAGVTPSAYLAAPGYPGSTNVVAE